MMEWNLNDWQRKKPETTEWGGHTIPRSLLLWGYQNHHHHHPHTTELGRRVWSSCSCRIIEIKFARWPKSHKRTTSLQKSRGALGQRVPPLFQPQKSHMNHEIMNLTLTNQTHLQLIAINESTANWPRLWISYHYRRHITLITHQGSTMHKGIFVCAIHESIPTPFAVAMSIGFFVLRWTLWFGGWLVGWLVTSIHAKHVKCQVPPPHMKVKVDQQSVGSELRQRMKWPPSQYFMSFSKMVSL